MATRKIYGICAALSIGLAAPALAHHSGALFDNNKSIELHGIVVEMGLKSPHSVLTIDGNRIGFGSETDEGERWILEAPPVGDMLRTFGIDRETIRPGDVVTVVARPHRIASVKQGRILTIITGDGAIYSMAAKGRLDRVLLSGAR
jgi:hypothetical protein